MTGLTLVMIAGLLLIITLIVIRFQDRSPVMPSEITLPDGTAPLAVTNGPGWYAVVTTDNHILIYDEITGQLRQTVVISTGTD